MRHCVPCPVCRADIIPCPFVGRVLWECNDCENTVILVLDGPSFESGTVRTMRLINGSRPGVPDPSCLWSVN